MDVNVSEERRQTVRKEPAGFPLRLYPFSLLFAKTPVDILKKSIIFRESDPFYLYELI